MTTNGIQVLTVEQNDEFLMFFNGKTDIWIKKSNISAIEFPSIQCINDLMILFIDIFVGSKRFTINCFLINSIKSMEELNEYRTNFQEFLTDPTPGIGIEFFNGSFEEK